MVTILEGGATVYPKVVKEALVLDQKLADLIAFVVKA